MGVGREYGVSNVESPLTPPLSPGSLRQVGVDLSRSKVYYFKHNDLADLEAVLKKVAKDDQRLGRDVTKQVGVATAETGGVCFGGGC